MSDRRDPSGYPPPWVNHMVSHTLSPMPPRPGVADLCGPLVAQALAHHLLDDHDIIYTTTKAVQINGSLPQLPDAATAFESTMPTGEPKPGAPPRPPPSRFEFTRRGQRCGDVGWGCFQTDPNETRTYGRTDGHGLVASDLNKKHQFMRLSGATRAAALPRLCGCVAVPHTRQSTSPPPGSLSPNSRMVAGDPGFDLRAGKLVPSTVSSMRRPDSMKPTGKAMITKRGS